MSRYEPPIPDVPTPLRRGDDSEYAAFGLCLEGIHPHEQESKFRYELEGKAIAPAMFAVVDEKEYRYAGLGVVYVRHLPPSADKVQMVTASTDKKRTTVVAVETTEMPARLTAVHVEKLSGGNVRLVGLAKGIGTTDRLAALPIKAASNTYASHKNYARRFDMRAFEDGKATLVVGAKPGTEYALVVVRGGEKKLQIMSPVWIERL